MPTENQPNEYDHDGYQYTQGRSRVLSAYWVAPKAGSAITLKSAVTDNGATQTITPTAQPDFARNVVVTPGGTTANVTAVSVVVNGTDVYGNVISETLPAFTAAASTAVTGVKAFASITSLVIPTIGTAVTTTFTCGSKLGLPARLFRNTVVYAFFNNVREATAPTVNTNSTDFSQNTASLNSALDGTHDVVVDYYR
jgi:hypothetical protein